MFTGLIEQTGKIVSLRRSGSVGELAVDLGSLLEGSRIGDSIAVDGICLTLRKCERNIGYFDVSGETLAKSKIASYSSGKVVNLERAMMAGSRFGGHFVQGHIDGTGKIDQITKQAGFAEFVFSASPELLGQMVEKGSVAVDGISLTIAWIRDQRFAAAVIPETLESTNLSKAAKGDTVNIETDIIVKTVQQQLQRITGSGSGLTEEKLRDWGF